MKLRAGLLAASVVAAIVPLGSTAFADPNATALSDPFANEAPSASFTAACTGMDGSRSALDACMSAAVPAYDQARQAEGLTPLVLPNDFDVLSAQEQLLALTDIERVDRGLPAIPALSGRLNTLAQSGANANQAPAFPSPFDGTGGGSSVSASGSTLLAVYDWMYDDAASGWDGRHTILGTGANNGGTLGYATPIAMGAGWTAGSITELVVAGDATDPADGTPTWDQIVGTSTFGVDKTNAVVAVQPGTQGLVTVTATSSNLTDTLTAQITNGEDQWTVSPATCPITPGASCTFTVTFSPPTAGRFPGLLDISSGLTLRTVGLAGIGTAPQVISNPDRVSLRRGQTLTIFGTVQDSGTQKGLAGVPVTLQTRLNGVSPWRTLTTITSDASGNATFRIQPPQSAAYRLVLLNPSGKVQSASPPQRVRVD